MSVSGAVSQALLMRRVVVVGAGILGTMHAWMARRAGAEVIHLDRDLEARGASVRNFGLVWVGGRRAGQELALALRSRQLWDEVAADVTGVGLRANGSLTVATSEEELAVLEQSMNLPDADSRQWELLDPVRTQELNPALRGQLLGSLWCRADAAVEPRRAAWSIRRRLEESGDGYRFAAGRVAMEARAGAVRDQTGQWHEGDAVFICTGASHEGLAAEALTGSGLRRCRLQMMETAPWPGTVTTSVADGDSLRYYPAYDVPARAGLPAQDELAAAHRIQLLLVQRLDGGLTIGDTHEYEEPFDFAVREDVAGELSRRTAAVLGEDPPPIARRWTGVYSETTDGSLYLRRELCENVTVVTGPGGRGMTMSAAIAEESFT